MKESPLTIPKKNSGRDFDFPPRPTLKRPKERPAGLSFGILFRGYGGFVTEGRWDGGRRIGAGYLRSFRTIGHVEDEIGEGMVVLAGDWVVRALRGTEDGRTKDGGSGRRGRRPLRGCGKPPQPPQPAGAQRSVRASGRKEQVGIDARGIKKGEKAAASARAAPCAEIVAGQIQFLPDDLFVQHGAQGSEV